MKKFLYLMGAAALLAACTAVETDCPDAPKDPASMTARIDERPSTRTAYTVDEVAGKAFFAWKAGDVVDVVVRHSAGYTGVPFTAQAGGTTARFLDTQVEGDLTLEGLQHRYAGATLSDWAFYPSRTGAEALQGGYNLQWDIREASGTESVTIDLPDEVTLPVQNPMAIVPLAGRMQEGGEYSFIPMTGVLGVRVTDLPSEADYIRIESAAAALSGSFAMDTDAVEITQTGTLVPGDRMTLSFSGLSGTCTFYFPVAAGTLPAGLTVTVGSTSDPEVLMRVSTVKDITVRTGVIAQCPPLAFTPVDQQWERVADGEFLDDFLWGVHSLYPAGTYVGVTVERSGLHPEKFRINNPYRVANTQFGYTPYAQGGSDDYLVFRLLDDDLVSFNQFRTGIEDKDSGGRLMMLTYPPSWSSSRPASENRVVSWRQDGLPGEVQLAAVYSQYEDPAAYMYSRDGSTQHTDRIHLRLIDDSPETWTAVGTGSYKDNFIFNNRLGYPADSYVNVTVERSSKDDRRFRIANPYPAIAASVGYSIPAAYTTAVDEFIFLQVATDGAVTFTEFRPGVGDTSRELAVCHPATWNSLTGDAKVTTNNRALGFQPGGLPTAVQLAPIYHEPGNYAKSGEAGNYFYSRDGYSDIIVLNFPQEAPEAWTSLGTGRYTDEYLWTHNAFAPYDVEVEIFRSEANPNRYRFANPYAVAATAFMHTAAGTGDDYVYLTVDPATGLVVYDDILTGMDRASDGRNYVAAHPASWNALKGTSLPVTDSKVAAGTASAPLEIQLSGVYYDSADNTYFYTNNTGLKHVRFPAWSAGETWTDYCEGTYKDNTYDAKINGSSALGTVGVTIQQSSLDVRRFRIANPYRVLTDVAVSTFDAYLYFRTGSNGYVYFEPFRPGVIMDNASRELAINHPVNSNLLGYSQGGSDMSGSSVLQGTADEPQKIQLGAHYYDIAGPNPGYCYTRHGSAWGENDRIVIQFSAAATAKVTHVQYPVTNRYDNHVMDVAVPAGTLDRVRVQVTGIDPSLVTGFFLMSGGSYITSDAAVDASGIAELTPATSVSGAFQVYFKLRGDTVVPAGTPVCFRILEVVVDNNALTVRQDADGEHHLGVKVRDGGDDGVYGYRIPALVTSRAGTLIAAYDIRREGMRDLQADIDVGVSRSTDGGKTWGPMIVAMDMGQYGGLPEAENGIGDPCLLVDERTGELFCFAVWTHGHAGATGLSYASTGFAVEDTPQLMMVTSTDDGLTWSAPVNLTRQLKRSDWRMTFQGPGRGITMADGTLVIPFQHQENGVLNSGIAYSTDRGLTWHTHRFARGTTSESAVAEIEPGVLMLNMRDETNSHTRAVYTTRDLGRTWTAHETDATILEPTCEASLLHVNAADNVLGRDLLLFSNPQATSRSRMTIQVSLDHGRTWSHRLLVDTGGSLGYSCLTMVDRETVGILYESSQANILFQAIPLTSLVKQ